MKPKITLSEEQTSAIIKGEQTVDNKIELLRFVSQVQSRIRRDISEDFVLAKLDDKNKEAIIEMTSNAYLAKKLILTLGAKATTIKWKDNEWIMSDITKENKEYIKEIANAIFDSYMNRVYMTVILNRNVEQNPLINILAGFSNEGSSEDELLRGKLKELGKTEVSK